MLSKKAKYALKALEYMVKANVNEPVKVSEISDTQGLPRKFLERIMLDLKQEGILISKVGKKGGYFLNRKPEEIRLSQIIRIIDGPVSLVPCVSERYYEKCNECLSEDLCGLKQVMAEIREATLKAMEKFTMKDVLLKEKKAIAAIK